MDWDEHAANWDEREDVRAYAEEAYESLERRCSELRFSLRGTRVCDFGCGTGLLSERLAVHSDTVVAIDSSEKMIATLARKVATLKLDNVHPLCMMLDSESLASSPLLSEPFDLVVCSSVCAFVDDYPATVALLAQRLRPSGLFVQWDWEANEDDEDPFGLTRDAIRAAHTAAGLDVLFLDTGFTLGKGDEVMAPLMAVGRKDLRRFEN
jgi:2-polyprenyl-3-methyl-5-hydroxy-6-metoxy-1,4-benzoquinol methylase